MNANVLKLTRRQAEVLAFLQEFFLENDQLPTLMLIAERFGFASPHAANCHMQYLWRKGAITKNAVGKWKFAAGFRPGAPAPANPVPMLPLPVLSMRGPFRGRIWNPTNSPT